MKITEHEPEYIEFHYAGLVCVVDYKPEELKDFLIWYPETYIWYDLDNPDWRSTLPTHSEEPELIEEFLSQILTNRTVEAVDTEEEYWLRELGSQAA